VNGKFILLVNKFRTGAILKTMRSYLADSKKVLDIGAGSCHISKTLQDKLGLEVTAIDKADHNIMDFPLKIYDGKKLPYKADEFDTSLLIFVLHHAADVEGLLAEAGRVSRKVIVVEDMPGKFEKPVWKRLDYLENHAQHEDIDVAHEPKSVQEWKELFNSTGFKVTGSKRFRSFFTTGLLYPHQVFVLERS
jgi:ubiquinone/menaquinone biosynthesis C-methylase UbiE